MTQNIHRPSRQIICLYIATVLGICVLELTSKNTPYSGKLSREKTFEGENFQGRKLSREKTFAFLWFRTVCESFISKRLGRTYTIIGPEQSAKVFSQQNSCFVPKRESFLLKSLPLLIRYFLSHDIQHVHN